MAIPLANVATTDTFQTWLNTTNFLATYMSGSVVTVNSTFSSTTGNGAVVGSFGATTLFANSALRGGNSSVASTLNITSNTVITGTANVSGVASFASAVNAASLSVTGTANVFGAAGFSSTVNAASLGVSGQAVFSSSVSAANLTTTTNTVTFGSAVYISGNGNVGVGTATPGSPLTISGNALVSGSLTLTGSLTTNTFVSPSASFSGNVSILGTNVTANNLLLIGDGTNAFIRPTNSGSFLFLGANNSSNLVTIASNGNLGVGISSPTSRLHVQGAILASDNITAYSDEKLKYQIETIESALQLVHQLRGVRYLSKDTGKPGIGVVAQEVINVLPEVVHNNDMYYSVAYGNMVGLLIEAIKDLSAQVEELKNKVK